MRRDPQDPSKSIARASIVMVMGAVSAACSGNAGSVIPSDASSDGNTSVDEGVPDVAVDGWGNVVYGPATCTDASCAPGFHCSNAGFGDCVPDDVVDDAASIDSGAPDAPNACDAGMIVYYGPMRCSVDSQCSIAEYGVGAWCDTTAGFMDPCGGFTSWPMCRMGDGGVRDGSSDASADQTAADGAVRDGRADVSPDQEAADVVADRQVLDANTKDAATIDDGSPEATNACDAAYYGPMLCDSDQQCVQVNGAESWCDTTAGFTDPCGRFIPWPLCRSEGGIADAGADGKNAPDSGED